MASEDITMAGSPENAEQYSFDASSQNQNQMTTHADLNEHDTGSNGDRDSAIDDAVGTSSTTSVTPSVRDCVYENGRAYQGSHADDYFKPKDERAQDVSVCLYFISMTDQNRTWIRCMISAVSPWESNFSQHQ